METVLVTGANRGVGLALIKHYVARGDGAVATVRDPGSAGDLNALAQASGKLRVLQADVTDEAALAAVARTLGDSAIDIVICNAGIMSSRGSIMDPGHDAAEWSNVLMSNVTGAFLSARAFLPHLLRAKTPKLAFISSQMASSTLADGRVLAYRASKAAMSNLGLNLAINLKSSGVAVGIYHPGWVQTGIGGPTAPITADASARGLIDRIDKLSLATTGVFEDYLGKSFSF